MIIYTIGFIQKSAEEFFETLMHRYVKILIDIRLHNSSQLAGFTKGRDLKYFLERFCGCDYCHCVNYAPTKKLLDDYKNEKITWSQYELEYRLMMEERKAVDDFKNRFDGVYESVCLLCAEPTHEHCHRSLFAEMIAKELDGTEIIHL
ncbi:MAG: DUF488 domain-containing protein [Synergistaceae bacterium]|nr:DUF488 domain-containing protein [Synergistaceae bacterium]